MVPGAVIEISVYINSDIIFLTDTDMFITFVNKCFLKIPILCDICINDRCVVHRIVTTLFKLEYCCWTTWPSAITMLDVGNFRKNIQSMSVNRNKPCHGKDFDICEQYVYLKLRKHAKPLSNMDLNEPMLLCPVMTANNGISPSV